MSCFSSFTLSPLSFVAMLLVAPAHAADANSKDHKALADFKSCAKPHYPADALKARHEGTVTLQFLVSVDGEVLDSKVDMSSGYPSLDESAHKAIKLCKFKPAIKEGKAVQDWTQMKYVWTLK